jgi:hypothetical protein
LHLTRPRFASQLLHESGCLWDEDVTLLAASTSADCLDYTLGHGCPVTRYAAIFSAESGRLDCYTRPVAHGTGRRLGVLLLLDMWSVWCMLLTMDVSGAGI